MAVVEWKREREGGDGLGWWRRAAVYASNGWKEGGAGGRGRGVVENGAWAASSHTRRGRIDRQRWNGEKTASNYARIVWHHGGCLILLVVRARALCQGGRGPADSPLLTDRSAAVDKHPSLALPLLSCPVLRCTAKGIALLVIGYFVHRSTPCKHRFFNNIDTHLMY